MLSEPQFMATDFQVAACQRPRRSWRGRCRCSWTRVLRLREYARVTRHAERRFKPSGRL